MIGAVVGPLGVLLRRSWRRRSSACLGRRLGRDHAQAGTAPSASVPRIAAGASGSRSCRAVCSRRRSGRPIAGRGRASVGSPGRIRTSIRRFRVCCPAVGRPGNGAAASRSSYPSQPGDILNRVASGGRIAGARSTPARRARFLRPSTARASRRCPARPRLPVTATRTGCASLPMAGRRGPLALARRAARASASFQSRARRRRSCSSSSTGGGLRASGAFAACSSYSISSRDQEARELGHLGQRLAALAQQVDAAAQGRASRRPVRPRPLAGRASTLLSSSLVGQRLDVVLVQPGELGRVGLRALERPTLARSKSARSRSREKISSSPWDQPRRTSQLSSASGR